MQHSDGSQQQPEGALLSTTPSSLAAISAIAVTHPTVSQLRVTGRVPVVTAATAAIGVVAAGQQGMLSTVAGVQPMTMSPQAVMVPTQTVSHLLSPATSVSANAVQISANLNVLQRQLSTPGVVGLSAVSAQDLQHVLQQASQQSITLLTATEAVGNSQQRPRLARPLSFSHSTPALPAVSSMSATGATIHHHGQSPVRGVTLSHSNLQHSLLGMNLNPQQQQQLSAQRRGATTAATTTTTTTTTSSAMAVMPAANIVAQSRTVLEVRAPSGQPPSLRTASGVPPRKKIRLEEKPPPNAEVASYRRQLVELKHKQMKELKSEYFENLTEMFFLQNGLNLIDYHTWKKRPTPQLVGFLTSGKLDSDDEDDVLQVKEINSEVKVLTNPGSNVPLATPVAISTTLPPLVSALSQQVVAPSAQQASAGTITSLTASSSQAIASSSTPSAGAASLSQLQQQLSRTQDSKSPSVKGQMPSLKQVKTPPMSPGQRLHTRQQSLSAVYDNLSGNSQEVIVERAKQEAQVVQRVAELRKEGLWSSKRLPRVQEPPRQKAHWDYLLEEMTWLAADFIQERKWKKAAARKVARMVFNYFKEQEQKELKAEKEEAVKLKKIASHMSKMVKEFWSNIEKVVQYKQQMRLDEKKKRALDLHLNFIMDQTEKYSSWLTESLQITSSINGSLSTSPSHSSDGGDFEPSENSTDDEETIQKEEDEAEGTEDHTEELEALMQEMDLPLEELLKTLPQEVLDTPAPLPPPLPDIDDDSFDRDDDDEGEEKKEDGSSKEEVEEKEKRGKADSDHEFTGAEEEPVDVEDTIDEQEKYEKHDYNRELQDLAEEGELSLDELADKYAGAYDSDFEVPKESSSEEEDNSELDSDDYEVETESSSDEEEEEEELKAEFGEGEEDSPGLEELTQPQQLPTASPAPTLATATRPAGEAKKGDQEDEVINDIAAQALSLQPKGYTLETTEVKTKVPFLLKHKLREYQHVGLDWLATMHDKHLNGILADEMGLGKTIQTIALLAHLACEKGNWGPHLIVVPTSVMLNWEMELKKWCPSFKILTYYGNQKERKLKRQGWTKTNAFHVCITSYKLVVQDHQAFRRKKWKYLILDEAQNIKNFKSQRWQMLLNFSSQRRLLLTGTPLQNSLMELWSLMHFLMPNVFQSHRDFKEWFSNPLTGMIEGSQEYNENLIKRLHRVLRPFLLRRLKNEVEKQMPQKYEHVVMCRLSKRQRYLYDDFMSQAKTKETLATGHYMSVINILMQLRKVCNHPNLFDPRPVVSPFFMEKLYYTTASPVNTILVKDPLEEVDMHTLFPNLAEMERDLPAFVAHRVKQLRTSPMLIEEIDYQPEPPPPLPKGQLKAGTFSISAPLLQQSGRLSPVVQALSGSPVDLVKAAVTCSATPTALTVSRPAVSSQITATPTVPLSIPLAALASSSLLTSTTSASATTSLPAAALSVSTAATLSQVRSLSGQPTLLLTTPGRTAGSAALVVTSSAPALVATATMVGSTGVNAVSGLSATPLTSTLQAKVLSQPSQGTVPGGGSAVLSTQPITVQIQQTNQGTRLMIPTGQLSQLPASLFQIVQTSSGQHLVATSTPTSLSTQVSAVLPVTSTASSTVNGPSTLTTVASTGGQGLVTTAVSQLKTITALTTIASTTPAPSSTVSSSTALSALSSVVVSSTSAKAPLRVTSLVTSTLSGSATTISTIAATTSTSCTTTTTTTTSCTLPASLVSSVVSTLKSVMSPKKRSELFLDSVYEKRKRRRREKLKRVASVNTHHCTHTPVYGPDLIETLTLSSDLSSQCHRERYWLRAGFAHCQCVHTDHNGNLPKYFWHETRRLSNLVHTPQQYLDQLKDVLDRFTFCIPSVISSGIELRLAHQDSSLTQQDRRLACEVREHLRPVNTLLNNLRMRMTIHFPELRLIQYDCGKLQTMDVLLRQLKSGSHRVLIFTQMTKMLDVLEAFLNYHGHRYLRLDGTTRVEQRQALMERFNADRRIFCFILSTRSGGIGVNLTGADTVIFYDSDWNPTMDAQAQDRCHRIGQTRDVHIYRLISEATVEENILKKANQKRLLGDLAIEGGNFTTAFFKEQTIKDLFAQPTGLKSLTEEKETMEVKEMSAEDTMDVTEEEPATPSNSTGKKTGKDKDANIMAAFEQALCKAEDETDAMAASLVKAEQKAELDDFDESIPWDEKEAEAKKEEEEMSRAEQELAMLDKELSGIERYAVAMMERQMEDEVMEELKMAEEDIENSKKDWELTRLKALKEEEERRARMEEDEMLYTYLCDDAQVFINALDGSEMPLWAPPTPPQDDNDVYVDQTLMFLHEASIMSETQLPPVYVRKDHRKPRIETITTRKQKQRKEEAPRVPRSLFDRPSAALVKMRRELKMQRLKAAGLGLHQKVPLRPTTLPAPLSHKSPMSDQSEGHPEWLIHEDWALLQAVQNCCHMPLNLTGYQNGHTPNWDLVADVVNSVSRTFRSIKQCRARYENVIIPREEGRILYDVSPRKQKKNKSTYKTKNNRPMKTSQLYAQDNNSSISLLYSLRFDAIRAIAAKRPAPTRQTLNNPTLKNPKHLAVLQENNINYDQPLNPHQVAAIRAERIQREKKASTATTANTEAAQQRPAQPSTGAVGERGAAPGVVQAVGVGGVAATAPTVAQAIASQQLHSLVSVSTPTTIIAGAAAPRAAVAPGISIPRTLAATGNIVAVTGGLGRGRVQVHDITTVAGAVTGTQVAAQTARATLQPTATASANLTQKMAAIAGTSALAGGTRTVQQLAKGLNQHINLLQPIIRSQAPGTPPQAQQLGHKVRFTQAVVRTMPGLTEEQLKALKVRQLQNKPQGGQPVKLQTAQILQGQVQQVAAQSGTTSAAPVTLVKTVSAPAGAIPVSINVTMAQPQQKAALPSRGPTVSQLQHQHMLVQQRKGVPLQHGQRVTALTSGVRSQIPLIKTPLTGQLLHQYIKQPAIISVSQAQSLTPTMVAKVSLPHSTPIHTLTAATGSPITVTQVPAAAATVSVAGSSGAGPGHQTPTVATISMANVSSATHTHATVVKAAAMATVEGGTAGGAVTPKMATLAQSLVSTQQLHIASTSVLQPTAQQQQQQQGAGTATLVGTGGVVNATVSQHPRVLTATPTTLPQATAVVVTTTTLPQAQPNTATTTVVQQHQQQPTAQIVSGGAAVVSAQAVVAATATPATMATVVTQTQPSSQAATVAAVVATQPQPSSPVMAAATAQLTAQQQLQKASPYTMRTRNQPKHS